MEARPNSILIVDFGSQYNQLIARRIREEKVYCWIAPPDISYGEVIAGRPSGIILSGGPASLTKRGVPKCDKRILESGIPILGICYGMQLIADEFGGAVKKAKDREYGKAEVFIDRPGLLFKGLTHKFVSWMSHGDYVERMPLGFLRLAHTKNTKLAAMADESRKLYGVQFHPEVVHTERGKEILNNFIFGICKCKPTWTTKSFIGDSLKRIRDEVGGGKVILGLSGGVDSSVCAVLINKAIGKRLTCIFVDNGLLRKYEGKRVVDVFRRHFNINLRFVKAEARFLKRLKGVTDPERKRKIIGNEFIHIFEEEARKIGDIKFLAQGTLYPDVIESHSAFGAPSATIKTHHNVGGLPKRMHLSLIEPLRELFKDEVRRMGSEMGLPDEIIWRQPFPGPGLAVRIIGEVTRQRLDLLREVDEIVLEEFRGAGLYKEVWQSFAVLLPIKSVGIMGDERTYENVAAIRAVTSQDGMTADWVHLEPEFLGRLSNRIINEVKGVNRVVYDISSKPPSTIEWE